MGPNFKGEKKDSAEWTDGRTLDGSFVDSADERGVVTGDIDAAIGPCFVPEKYCMENSFQLMYFSR